MSTATLPSAVSAKLSSARVRLRAVDLALGLARATLAALVVLVVLFALDTALEPPIVVVRAFALFMALIAAAISTVFLARPLRRPLSDDDVALLVEAEFPELEDGLVSTVQLAREVDAPNLWTSRQLIRSMIDRTAARSAGLDFGRVVRTGPLVPLWVLIIACVGLGGLIAKNPTTREYLDAFWRRVALGEDVGYPKLVKLEVASSDREIAVAKGDDLSIDVKVTRGANLVNRLTMRTAFKGVPEPEVRDLLRVGAGVWRKAYQNIVDDFAFRAEDEEHGVTSQTYQVRVVQRPRVDAYDLVLRYPDYTGKATEVLAQPDVSVPVGTELTYVVLTNKPVESAGLVFETEKVVEGGKKRETEVTAGPPTTFYEALPAAALADGGEWAAAAPAVRKRLQGVPDAGRRLFVGKFVVSRDARFRFKLLSREPDGQSYDEGKKPVVFSVTAQQDQKPTVNIPVPGRRKQATPQGKVALGIEARDDYGLQAVELHLRVEHPGETAPGPVEKLVLPGLEPNARQAKLGHVLNLADLRLQPGDVLHYTAVAIDRNIDEGARTRESRPFEVQVVRPEDLERVLQDRLAALKERLEAAAREEGEAKTTMDAFVAELGPKDVLSDEDKRRLQRVDQDQRRVTQRLVEVTAEVDDIRSERELNRLTDDAAMSLVADLLDAVRGLAERDSPAISRELDDGRVAPRVDDRVRTRLARIPDLQQALVEKLQALAARIGKWGDFTEALQEARDLLEGQIRVQEGTKAATQQQNR
jgi:hypothetical protein